MHTKSTARLCVVCDQPVKRRERSARFCSRACYNLYWKDNVSPKASRLGNEAIKRQMRAGDYCQRGDGGRFLAKAVQRTGPVEPIMPAILPADDDEDGWLERAEYWQTVPLRSSYRRRTWAGGFESEAPPLVLNGHGVRVRVDKRTLLISNGLTHYPQEQCAIRLFPGDRNLPPRILLLDADGYVTFDAMAWLSEQGVPLIQLDWQGRVLNVVGVSEGWYDADLRRAQRRSMTNGVGLEVSTQLIRAKLEASRTTLQGLWQSPARDAGLVGLSKVLAEIKAPPASSQEVRLIEARGAAVYFSAWQDQPIKWKGLIRRPIPADWHRCCFRNGVLATGNRHAAHPVNALLNYAYTVLESEVRIAVMEAGARPRNWVSSLEPKG